MPPHKDIDVTPPEAGLRTMRWWAIATIVCSILGWAIAPNNGVLCLTFIGLAVFAMRLVSKRLAKALSDFQALGEKRSFKFESGIPYRLDETGKVVSDPHNPTWEPDGVCHRVVKAIERIRNDTGAIDSPWYRREVLPEHLPGYHAQEALLKERLPERHGLVLQWFLEGFAVPALERRFPTHQFKLVSGPTGARVECRLLEPADQPFTDAPADWCREVALDYQYERYFGIVQASHPQSWSRRIDRRPSQRAMGFLHNALLDLYQGQKPNDPPLTASATVTFPVPLEYYIGKGFIWERRHAERLHEQYRHDQSEVGRGQDQGDPRIFGVGADEVVDQFLVEEHLNYHTGIQGTTGVGKTRFVEPLMVQAIRSGKPLIFIDPKVDRTLLNRVFEVARAYGKGHRVHLFHLNAPRCPEISHYNPLYEYDDPAELATRVAAVVPKSKDPFWFKVGVSTARSVCMLSAYVLLYLRMIGSERRDGTWQLAPRFTDTPPRLLLALQVLMDQPGTAPEVARGIIDTFLVKRRDPSWKPTNDTERNLLEMCRLPFYSPKAWNPSLKPINVFGVGAPEIMVAWAIKVTYFHLFLLSEREDRKPNRPELLDIATAVGSSDRSWWTKLLNNKVHPLEARLMGAASPITPEIAAYFDEFVPREAVADEDIKRAIYHLGESLRSMRTKAVEDRKEYQKHMTTLQAALSAFEGERETIVSSIDPDIVLRRAVQRGDIVYMAMNQLKDKEAMEGMARTIVCDVMSFLGETYGRSEKGRRDFYFACDEVPTFLTDDMVPILSQGRGAGARTILLGQTGADLTVALQDSHKAEQVVGNLSTKVQLRTETFKDAREFSEAAGKVTIQTGGNRSIGTTRGYGDGGLQTINGYSQNENRQFQDKEVELVQASAMLRLPKFHAFIRSMGELRIVVQGLLPNPECNVLEEMGILRYEDADGERREQPEIVSHRAQELEITNTRLALWRAAMGVAAATPMDAPSEMRLPPTGSESASIDSSTIRDPKPPTGDSHLADLPPMHLGTQRSTERLSTSTPASSPSEATKAKAEPAGDDDDLMVR